MIEWLLGIALGVSGAQASSPRTKPKPSPSPSKSIAPKKHSSLIIEKIKLTQSGPGDAPSLNDPKIPRSKEWKKLPRQDWEQTHQPLPAEIDPLGFDRRSIIRFKKPTGFELPVFISTDRIPLLGQIIGAKSEGVYLSMGDLVYLRSDDNLQVGEVYGLTQEPYVLRSRKSSRLGYSYTILGKVKVTGVKDGMFLGIIQSAREFISRGTSLVTMPPRIRNLNPIPGPEGVDGYIVLDRNFSTYTAAQHKIVVVDRGTQDGVQPGMVFRAYEHVDPSNNKRLTNANVTTVGDLLVIQVTRTHSEALIVRGNGPLFENSSVVLLSDVKDLQSLKRVGMFRVSPSDQKPKSEMDDLDQLDAGGEIGNEEEKELKQLEKWRSNPAVEDTAAEPSIDGVQEQPKHMFESEKPPAEDTPTAPEQDAPLTPTTPSQQEMDETSPITPEVAAPAEEKAEDSKPLPPVEEPEFPAR